MMRQSLLLFALAAVLALPACNQSYVEDAKSGETGQRQEDRDEAGKSVHDQADDGMAPNKGDEGQSNNSETVNGTSTSGSGGSGGASTTH